MGWHGVAMPLWSKRIPAVCQPENFVSTFFDEFIRSSHWIAVTI